jgi:putative glycosyltransferase (TIGR04372 family)
MKCPSAIKTLGFSNGSVYSHQSALFASVVMEGISGLVDEFVYQFLRNPVWRTAVRIVGPTLTLRFILSLGVARWGWHYYSRGKYQKPLLFFFAIQPNALSHPGFYSHLVYHYDTKMVPKKACRPNPILWLVGVILSLLRVKFVWNVAVGTGHNTVELDYFFRLQSQKEYAHIRAVLLRRPNPFHNDTIGLYRSRFFLASSNPILCDLLFPLAISSEKLRIDCGLARGKWQLRTDGKYNRPPLGQTHLNEISKAENVAQYSAYFALRARTEDKTPLSECVGLDQELQDFLGTTGRKIAVVHMKFQVINATALPSDPASYEPAIRWLIETGYQVVFAGREPFPSQFGALGVLNYSESSLATYRHDLQLFAASSVAITAGSGIAYLADCMGKPYVYLDSWHLTMAMPSQRCVFVPAIVQDQKTDKYLSLKEQSDLYLRLSDIGGERFPSERYKARNASAEEVLAALQETLSLAEAPAPLSPEQARVHKLLPAAFQPLVKSRISQFFIDRYTDLLPD